MPDDCKWQVVFYVTSRGDCPVRDFLNGLDVDTRVIVSGRIDLLAEQGVALQFPHVKKVDGRLWELRCGQVRILYTALPQRRFIMLHAFKKKRNRIPPREIGVAKGRLDAICSHLGII